MAIAIVIDAVSAAARTEVIHLFLLNVFFNCSHLQFHLTLSCRGFPQKKQPERLFRGPAAVKV
jgi:hypothetical protein